MIDAQQLRAARALLDWKTTDLAEKSGLTVNAINKIERGSVHGRRDTMEKIQKVFEDAGVEFLPNSGLRKMDKMVITHEGSEANKRLLDDIFETLKAGGGEVLIANVDESRTIDHLSKTALEEHLERLKAANITERLLVRKGDINLIAPFEYYHAIPEEYFSPYQFYIYGHKLALMSRMPSPKIIIIDDDRFADCVRKLFNYVWERTERPVLPRNK